MAPNVSDLNRFHFIEKNEYTASYELSYDLLSLGLVTRRKHLPYRGRFLFRLMAVVLRWSLIHKTFGLAVPMLLDRGRPPTLPSLQILLVEIRVVQGLVGRTGMPGISAVLDADLQEVQDVLFRLLDVLLMLSRQLVVVLVAVLLVVFRLEDVRVLQECLGQIPADLLPDGLLHGQVAFQVSHVAFRQGLAGVGVVVAVPTAAFSRRRFFVVGLEVLVFFSADVEDALLR